MNRGKVTSWNQYLVAIETTMEEIHSTNDKLFNSIKSDVLFNYIEVEIAVHVICHVMYSFVYLGGES